jgi:hypothetical protein
MDLNRWFVSLRNFAALALVVSLAIILGGCASTAEGVTRALVNNDNAPIPRNCEVSGAAFGGLLDEQNQLPDSSSNTIKVMLVHGIGTHPQGWSIPLQRRLAGKLGLNSMDRDIKRIRFTSPDFAEENLGKLMVTRMFDPNSSLELIAYELSWSEITQPWKDRLAFDTTGHFRDKRASFNQDLKVFLNDRLLDPVAYLGNSHDQILNAAADTFCFMAQSDWRSIPESGGASCDLRGDRDFASLSNDQFMFITHSLGSRIASDAFQSEIAELRSYLKDESIPAEERQRHEYFLNVLQTKKIRLYMMANQLPLLEAGLPGPRVVGQTPAFCEADGEQYTNRILEEFSIIAFSDPNDPLSYGLPWDFARESVDSRLCPRVVNVSINVTDVLNPLGFVEFAPPLEAHVGYLQDELVLDIITSGVGTPIMSEEVAERCTWINIE